MFPLRADTGRTGSRNSYDRDDARNDYAVVSIRDDLRGMIAAQFGDTVGPVELEQVGRITQAILTGFQVEQPQPHRWKTEAYRYDPDIQGLRVRCAACGELAGDVDSAHCPRFWVGLDTPWMRCGNHDIHLPHRHDGVICPGVDLERLEAEAADESAQPQPDPTPADAADDLQPLARFWIGNGCKGMRAAAVGGGTVIGRVAFVLPCGLKCTACGESWLRWEITPDGYLAHAGVADRDRPAV